MKKSPIALLVIAAASFLGSSLSAATYNSTWENGFGDGAWVRDGEGTPGNGPENWSTFIYPSNGRQPVSGFDPNPLYNVVLNIPAPCTLIGQVFVETVNVSAVSSLNVITSGNLGRLRIDNGQLTNNGTITLGNGTLAGGGELYLESTDAVLNGTGTILLRGVGTTVNVTSISFNAPTQTHGAGHTIHGLGSIYGGDAARLINNGAITADDPTGDLQLFLSRAANIINDNNSTIKAINGGILGMYRGIVDQTGGGRFLADGNGSVVIFGGGGGAKIIGGTLETANGGLLKLFPAGGAVYLDDVTNNGSFFIPSGNNPLIVSGTVLTNNGTIAINDGTSPGGFGTELQFETTSLLDGTGSVFLRGIGTTPGVANINLAGPTITHGPNHTIHGRGSVNGGDGSQFINHGSITADEPNSSLALNLSRAAAIINQNSGTIKAINGAILGLYRGDIDQTGNGNVLADGSGSIVHLGGGAAGGGQTAAVRVRNGTLKTTNGGVIHSQYAFLAGNLTVSGAFETTTNSQTRVEATTLTNNGTITLNGPGSRLFFDLNSTEIKGTGAIILTPQSDVVLSTNQHVVNGNGHTIKGNGIIYAGAGALTNNGKFSPGLSAGKITFGNGNYVQGNTGVLEIEIGGTTAATEYDQLVVSGTATVGGKLNISLLNGFLPSPGNVFNVVTSFGVGGAFLNVASGERLNTLDGNGSFIVSYSGSNVVLSSFGPVVSGANTDLRLRYVSPGLGGDTGIVTLTLIGQNIQQGATVILRRAGQADIVGVVRSISADGSTAEVTFDLTGKTLGGWEVVVTNPDAATSSLNNAFTIEQGRPPDVSAFLVGPSATRRGISRYFLSYNNRGNTDSAAVDLRVTLPRGVIRSAGLPFGSNGAVAHFLDNGDSENIQLYLRDVPANSSGLLPLQLNSLVLNNGYEIAVTSTTSRPLQTILDELGPIDPTASITGNFTENTAESFKVDIHVSGTAGNFDIPTQFTRAATTQTQDPAIIVTGNNGILTFKYEAVLPGPAVNAGVTPHGAGPSAPADTGDELVSVLAQLPGELGPDGAVGVNLFNQLSNIKAAYNSRGTAKERAALNAFLLRTGAIHPSGAGTLNNLAAAPVVLNNVNLVISAPGSPVNNVVTAQFSALVGVMDGAWELHVWQQYRTDIDFFLAYTDANGNALTKDELIAEIKRRALEGDQKKTKFKGRTVGSFDPNEKTGPQGAGAEHYIRGTEPISYALFFENKADATAPAQEVVITDQLDVTKLDLATFQLGAISFGNNTVLAPPPGLTQWIGDADLRPAKNLIVRVFAGLDKDTGLVTWHFYSLDPATMAPTTDPLAGFLPPNQTAPEGDGAVTFTVGAKAGLANGTQILNQARIVFDTNAPIDTPQWLNTIDNSPPTSQVAALSATNTSPAINVSWSGSDSGAGIESYKIYVSENGGAYTLWLITASTSGVYQGRPNATYSFYSVAVDGAGNFEAPPGPADTSTTILSGQLLNISTRARVLTGDNVMIGGFIITGPEAKKVMIRALGPTLDDADPVVPDSLDNPTLTLHDGNRNQIDFNDDWNDRPEPERTEIENSSLKPNYPIESAMIKTLSPGAYTAIERGKNETIGVGLVEVYDLSPNSNSTLTNISTRAFVDTGDNVLIVGFIVGGGGGGSATVIVRAIGPALSAFGVPNVLQDPTLELHDGNGALLVSNDNWKDTQQTEIEATRLPPTDNAESAVVFFAPPGNTTAIVRGKNDTTGVALVEVYNVQ